MSARAFSKPSLARSARFLAASWPASTTTFFIVSWKISACRRTRRCQPSNAILFALARASMFFRSRSTSAAKSTPGSRNWLISLVKSKNGVSPAAAFSVGLMSLDTAPISVGSLSLETAPFFVGLLSSDTVPFSVDLLLWDTVPFFVGLLSLDMMFPLFGLVERPRELVAVSKLSALRLGPPEVAPVHPVFVGEFDTAKLTGSTAFGGSTEPLLITLQRTLIELNVIRRGV